MPTYRMADTGTIFHVKMGGRQRKPDACAEPWAIDSTQRCLIMAAFACDWKMPSGGTCDAPLCKDHAHEVATNKHLCSTHRDAYNKWLANRERSRLPTPASEA